MVRAVELAENPREGAATRPDALLNLARCRRLEASLLHGLNRDREAEQPARLATRRFKRLASQFEESLDLFLSLQSTRELHAEILLNLGRYGEAEVVVRDEIRDLEERRGSTHFELDKRWREEPREACSFALEPPDACKTTTTPVGDVIGVRLVKARRSLGRIVALPVGPAANTSVPAEQEDAVVDSVGFDLESGFDGSATGAFQHTIALFEISFSDQYRVVEREAKPTTRGRRTDWAGFASGGVEILSPDHQLMFCALVPPRGARRRENVPLEGNVEAISGGSV